MSRAVLLGQYGRVNSDRSYDLDDGLALAVTEPDSTAAELMTFLGGLGQDSVNPQNRIEDACIGVLGGQLAFDVRVESQGIPNLRW